MVHPVVATAMLLSTDVQLTLIHVQLHGAIYIVKLFLITFFSLPFSELCLAGLALDLVD